MTKRWEPARTAYSVTEKRGTKRSRFCDGYQHATMAQAQEVCTRWNGRPYPGAGFFVAEKVTIPAGWVHDLGTIRL